MSTPYPQGEDGRPLTRRELRELAERQITQSLQERPAPAGQPTVFPAQQQQRGQQSSNAPQQPNPASFPAVNSQPADQQRTMRPAPQFGDQQSTQSAYPVESFAFSEQRTGASTSSLQARPIAQPVEQPVQVSRRSMHQVPQGAGIPQVTPPSQASAVRMLEETGTISNLVDPSFFEPTQEPVSMTGPAVVSPSRASAFGAPESFPSQPAGRSNLSGFMRQAPPSSQIPRVVQDSDGNWTAASPQAVQDQFENQNAMLPTWGDSSMQFGGFNASSAQNSAVFSPERSDSAPELPARNSALNSMRGTPNQPAVGTSTQPHNFWPTGAPQSVTPFGSAAQAPSLDDANRAQVPTFATVPTQPTQPVNRGLGFSTSQPDVERQTQAVPPISSMPAWDAITAVDSKLPQDPTLGGVSASAVLTGEMPPVLMPVRATPNAAPAGTVNAGFGSAPADLDAPVFPPLQQNHATSSDPAMFSPVNGGATPAHESGRPFSEFGPDESGLEDEDFEIDHSYTWLQYMILIAVAFVLGMIIWRVAIDPDRQASEEVPEASPFSNSQMSRHPDQTL